MKFVSSQIINKGESTLIQQLNSFISFSLFFFFSCFFNIFRFIPNDPPYSFSIIFFESMDSYFTNPPTLTNTLTLFHSYFTLLSSFLFLRSVFRSSFCKRVILLFLFLYSLRLVHLLRFLKSGSLVE